MLHFRMIGRLAIMAIPFSLFISGCGSKNGNIGNSSHLSDYSSIKRNESIIVGSAKDFSVNVSDRVLFDLDSSSIRPDAQQILALQAKWLANYPHHTITIEGHADERGTREYNIALGQRRAVAVRDYLISLGVSSKPIKTVSYGKERPVAFCDDLSCWEQNRRVVTVID